MITTLPITDFSPSEQDTIFDVRDPDSYQQGHIQHAKNVPLDTIAQTLATTDARTIYVLCGGGTKAGKAAEQIHALDPTRQVVHLTGGTRAAVAAGWTIVVEALVFEDFVFDEPYPNI